MLRAVFLLLFSILPALASAQPAKTFSKPPAVPLPPVTAQCAGIQIHTVELLSRDAQAYCEYAMAERAKVEAYWGATWTGPIRIHIDREYRISRAFVPGHFGNRGFMEMPLQRVLARDGALLHEIVHIYAPGANRFLAEGLAVYLHEKLAANRAFPNFGRDISAMARDELRHVPSLAPLNALRTPTPLQAVMDERTAYVLAGSFVGYLIERFGLPAFRAVYENGSYEQAYGKTLAQLEQEWRAALANL
jgi:hypothetical protein